MSDQSQSALELAYQRVQKVRQKYSDFFKGALPVSDTQVSYGEILHEISPNILNPRTLGSANSVRGASGRYPSLFSPIEPDPVEILFWLLDEDKSFDAGAVMGEIHGFLFNDDPTFLTSPTAKEYKRRAGNSIADALTRLAIAGTRTQKPNNQILEQISTAGWPEKPQKPFKLYMNRIRAFGNSLKDTADLWEYGDALLAEKPQMQKRNQPHSHARKSGSIRYSLRPTTDLEEMRPAGAGSVKVSKSNTPPIAQPAMPALRAVRKDSAEAKQATSAKPSANTIDRDNDAMPGRPNSAQSRTTRETKDPHSASCSSTATPKRTPLPTMKKKRTHSMHLNGSTSELVHTQKSCNTPAIVPVNPQISRFSNGESDVFRRACHVYQQSLQETYQNDLLAIEHDLGPDPEQPPPDMIKSAWYSRPFERTPPATYGDIFGIPAPNIVKPNTLTLEEALLARKKYPSIFEPSKWASVEFLFSLLDETRLSDSGLSELTSLRNIILGHHDEPPEQHHTAGNQGRIVSSIFDGITAVVTTAIRYNRHSAMTLSLILAAGWPPVGDFPTVEESQKIHDTLYNIVKLIEQRNEYAALNEIAEWRRPPSSSQDPIHDPRLPPPPLTAYESLGCGSQGAENQDASDEMDVDEGL